MVQYLKSVDVPERSVLLITPPPLCEPAWEKECLAQGEGPGPPVGSVLRGPETHVGLCLQAR